MLAAKDKEIAFLVLMAGSGIRGDKILLAQQELIHRAQGESEENIQITKETNKGVCDIINSSSSKDLDQELHRYIQERMENDSLSEFSVEMEKEKIISNEVKKLKEPWLYYILTYDPTAALKKVNVPVLAINGEKDLQVTPKENLQAIEQALKEGGILR